MLKSHKYWLGLFWLVTIFILPLPLIITLAHGLSGTINQSELFASQLGSIAYVWMLFSIMVSEKPKWLDSLIGLPEMYFTHGVMGCTAILFSFIHKELLHSYGAIALTGNIALYLFIGIALYSIIFLSGWITSHFSLLGHIKKKLEKIFRYETSVWIHKLNLVATLFVFGHVILIDYIRSISSFMFWFYLYSILTACVYIYMKTIKKVLYHSGKLIGNQKLSHNITELRIHITHRASFKAGDYAFISFPEVSGMKEPHPFSIVNYNSKKRTLTFAIRNQADFTKNINHLKLGSKVIIDGSYGRLYHAVKEHEPNDLILIGSGIGSVPLISLAINLQNSRPITFIRIASKEEDLIYEAELINIANKNTKFIYHSQIGRLTTEQIIKLYSKEGFYLIGGSPQMMRGTKKLLMNGGVNRAQIYGEKFNF